jgi:hypothetical protein
MIDVEGYILRSIDRHGHFGDDLHLSSISILLKALQKDLKIESDEHPAHPIGLDNFMGRCRCTTLTILNIVMDDFN